MQNPRPRKYASDAERQAAYRNRASMVEFRADEKTAEKLTEIADTLDISRSDLLLSMVKFALTNHQWARFGLTHKTLPRYEENPMATKKFSPAQIAAQKLFAERARAGTLGKGKAAAKRKTNPDKSKPRAYVKRASQATGAPPSKRLVTRRKKALSAPAGYFPNPKVKYTNRAKDLKGEQRVGYAVHMADRPSYQAIAWFSKKDDAVKVAQEASDRTGKQLAVTRVRNYFGAM